MDKVSALRSTAASVITEARGKKKKSDEKSEQTPRYTYACQFDFSPPLDGQNVYKQDGASAWGPQTGKDPELGPDDAVPSRWDGVDRGGMPKFLSHAKVDEPVEEATDRSVWESLAEAARPAENVWESLLHIFERNELR